MFSILVEFRNSTEFYRLLQDFTRFDKILRSVKFIKCQFPSDLKLYWKLCYVLSEFFIFTQKYTPYLFVEYRTVEYSAKVLIENFVPPFQIEQCWFICSIYYFTKIYTEMTLALLLLLTQTQKLTLILKLTFNFIAK